MKHGFHTLTTPQDDYIETARKRAKIRPSTRYWFGSIRSDDATFMGVPEFREPVRDRRFAQLDSGDCRFSNPALTCRSSSSSRRPAPARRRPPSGGSPACTRRDSWTASTSPSRHAPQQSRYTGASRALLAISSPTTLLPSCSLCPATNPVPMPLALLMTPLYDDACVRKTIRKTERPWASRNPKRYLAAQIAVGTVDQAMMGALQVRNAHMRAACLARNLLVVDEVHASDAYMSVVLEALLDAHVGAGGYALLMSATLGSAARHGWLHHGKRAGDGPTLDKAIDVAYPAVSTSNGVDDAGENDQKKTVSVETSPTMHDFADTARRALTAARVGAKVLVVRNTVGHAVSTQQALEEFGETGDAGLLFDVEGKSERCIMGDSPPATAQCLISG